MTISMSIEMVTIIHIIFLIFVLDTPEFRQYKNALIRDLVADLLAA